jgi:hypothetical protein
MSERRSSFGQIGFYLVPRQGGNHLVLYVDSATRHLLVASNERPRGPFGTEKLAREIALRFSLTIVEEGL